MAKTWSEKPWSRGYFVTFFLREFEICQLTTISHHHLWCWEEASLGRIEGAMNDLTCNAHVDVLKLNQLTLTEGVNESLRASLEGASIDSIFATLNYQLSETESWVVDIFYELVNLSPVWTGWLKYPRRVSLSTLDLFLHPLFHSQNNSLSMQADYRELFYMRRYSSVSFFSKFSIIAVRPWLLSPHFSHRHWFPPSLSSLLQLFMSSSSLQLLFPHSSRSFHCHWSES